MDKPPVDERNPHKQTNKLLKSREAIRQKARAHKNARARTTRSLCQSLLGGQRGGAILLYPPLSNPSIC